jgi:hypothetical protein
MARNKTPGDKIRRGAVKPRSQIKNEITGTWTKRDDKSGKFLDVKADPKPFNGVRKEKTVPVPEASVTRLGVIEGSKRVYVRDPRTGGPISVELSYQDEGRTLKIFVSPRQEEKKGDV